MVACTPERPDAVVPPAGTPPVEPAILPAATGVFANFPPDVDFFADLPVTFPESVKYRVSRINVSGINEERVGISAWFTYDLTAGRLASKLFVKFNDRYRTWQHNYGFDVNNRLISETSDKLAYGGDEYAPVDITYEYEGDLLKTIIRKTAAPTNHNGPALNRVTTYRYEGNRRVGATLLNYYNVVAVGNVPYPMDSTRRTFTYADAGRSISEQDSVWLVPCYPNMPCITKFNDTASTHRQFDGRGDLVTVRTAASSALYPNGGTTFAYEYNGPDGLISRIVNVNAGLAYQFLYQEK